VVSAVSASPIVSCPACGAPDSPASQFCTSCGTALSPTEVFAGEHAGDTAQCDQCGRFNPPDTIFCAACGRPLAPVVPQVMDQASSRPRRSMRSGVRLVAIKSFRYLDRYTHKEALVREGITYCTSEAECYQVNPSAFAAVS